jgi:glycosyltransferase involved in cell wall biosynthesis
MISVVACVKNRAANVKKWLASLELQTADLQVVLVDYCSTDDIKSVMDDSPIAVGYIPVEDIKTENDKFPEAYLKNVGIRHASSKVIACTNVDVCYEPHFFEVCERQLGHNTLVMAVRKNAPEGMPVPIDAGDPQEGRKREGDGPPWSATIVWGRDTCCAATTKSL